MTEVFSIGQLRKFNGQNGRPCYIAYNGLVYDVSDSTLWADGLHIDEHFCGTDLTAYMEVAPHGAEVLEDFPVVGELE